YEFTAKEVDVLEAATNELEKMTLQAAQHVIDNKLYARLAIPEMAVPLIESSWEAEPPSLYGRFDLAFDGVNPPKLLEYNADTPTGLLEAAVVQWYWLQDCFPKRDQFNSLHERLVALWKELAKYLPGRRIDFCSMDDAEDGMTVTYLQDTAQQAGLAASIFPSDESGWLKWGTRAIGVVTGLALAAICGILWVGRDLAAPGDIASALSQNPDVYTLSLGHMTDLTMQSFAYLR